MGVKLLFLDQVELAPEEKRRQMNDSSVQTHKYAAVTFTHRRRKRLKY